MAKIHQERITVTINRLVKDGQERSLPKLATPEMMATLEAVIDEIVADQGVVVEAAEVSDGD
jgi:hypothetical protein